MDNKKRKVKKKPSEANIEVIEVSSETNKATTSERKASSEKRSSSARKASSDRKPSFEKNPSSERKSSSERKPSSERKAPSKKGKASESPSKLALAIGKLTEFSKSSLCAYILTGIHTVLTLVFLSIVLYINMLPVKFFIPMSFVLLVTCAVSFLLAFTHRFKHVGKIVSVIMILIVSIGIYFTSVANDTFEKISGANTKTDVVNVYVMKADEAEDLTSAADYIFGIMSVLDRTNTDKTITTIEDKLGKKIEIKEYEGYVQLAEALYKGEVKAVIMNSAYIANLEENEDYSAFSSLTRVLMQTTHTTQIQVDTNKDIKNQSFVLYLSGIDIEGKVSTTSRSDVNIIAVVNPDTRQVLLVNTPRDYWVPLSISNGTEDKLTHAGIYGIDVSMDTLEMIYDVELDYFFRINFTGFKKVIDALGGVEVYSEYAFTSHHGKYKFKKGYNTMNGKQALGFVRERYAFRDGDNQRGKNQMAVIKAIADKAVSPAFLNNFSDLMNSIEGSFETSLSSKQISSLVRMQLDEGGSWNVLSYSATGRSAMMPVYSMSTEQSVMIPDEASVQKAKKLIDMVIDGEILTEEIIENLDKEETNTDN